MGSFSPRKSDTTTVFVSLSLSMLVIFVFLNTAVFPSKKQLRKVYPKVEKPTEAPFALFPPSLRSSVIRFTPEAIEPSFEFEESSLLIDGESLEQVDEHGRTKRAELHSWLSELTHRKNVQIDVTCFFDVDPGTSLISGMRQRQAECGEEFAAGLDAATMDALHFYGRMLPPQLGHLLDHHSLNAEQAYVVTLTRTEISDPA